MILYGLFYYDDDGKHFRGIFENIHAANNAIATWYVENTNDGDVNTDFKYIDALFSAFEDEDTNLIDCLLSRYHDFIFNNLENNTLSTNFDIIELEFNTYYEEL